MTTAASTVFTIGHSTHPIEKFIDLLRLHGIQRLVDVRSSPASRHNPQYNFQQLRSSIEAAGIEYGHEKCLGGREIGGDVTFRLMSETVVGDGGGNGSRSGSVASILLDAVGRSGEPDANKSNINDNNGARDQGGEISKAMRSVGGVVSAAAAAGDGAAAADNSSVVSHLRVAMMCSESNFRECHRQNLAHFLVVQKGIAVSHILPNGQLEAHTPETQVALTQRDAETEAHVSAAVAASAAVLSSSSSSSSSVTVQHQQSENQREDQQAAPPRPAPKRKNRNRLQ